MKSRKENEKTEAKGADKKEKGGKKSAKGNNPFKNALSSVKK